MSKFARKVKKSNIALKDRIQFKLISLSAGLFFIGLVLILFILAIQIDRNAYLDFKDTAVNQLDIVENYINNFYTKLDENINMLATNPTVIKADSTITNYKNSISDVNMTPSKNGGIEQEIFEVFNQFAKTHPDSIYVYAATEAGGYVRWPQSTINKGYDPTTRDWYQDAVKAEGKIIKTAPYVNSATQSMITSNVRALYNSEGKIIGTVGIDISQEVISDILGKMKIGKTGFSMLVHNCGTIMADGNHPENNYKMLDETNIEGIEKVLTDSDLEISIDGVKYVGVSSPVEGTDWVVASFTSEKELRSSSRKVIYSVVAIGIIILAGVISLMSLSIKKMIIPLKNLTDITDQLAKGNLDIDINVNSRDEIGLLAASMNTLVKRLKSHINYINEISELLGEIGKGNLNLNFIQAYDGEFEIIKEALVNTTDMLNETISQINLVSEQVASGSEQVSGGAQALSQGATEQASSIEELSATINEISSQITQTAENASKAKDYSIAVNASTIRSQQLMNDMIEAMNEISNTSNQIEKIIKSIDDIAFQTNILALNAAVEAARAGSAGKGFAVVADEVRNLAGKSAESAKNTSELIQNALHAIKKGTVIVSETAKSLQEVVQGSEKSSDIIQYIADASNEQAQSIVQVNIGIEQISSVVQTNSATAEESAAASEELSAQAQTLNELLEKFILKDNESVYYENEMF